MVNFTDSALLSLIKMTLKSVIVAETFISFGVVGDGDGVFRSEDALTVNSPAEPKARAS